MRRMVVGLLAGAIALVPVVVPPIIQRSWAQTEGLEAELERLQLQALEQSQRGQPQEAIVTLQQALEIARQLRDRENEAIALLGLGFNYKNLGQNQRALDFYNQALPISQEVGNRAGEGTTLSNIALIHRDNNRPDEAIANYERSLEIALEIRQDLQRDNRQAFSREGNPRATAIALADLLIEQNQPDRALEWLSRIETFELADYTRLIDAEVADPEAQRAIEDWRRLDQQRQFLSGQLQEEYSEDLARRYREIDAETNQLAQSIIRDFPEIAELFETTLEDIEQLRANLPEGTLVIQPVLLPNTIAIFILAKDRPVSVKRVPIDPEEFDTLVTDFRNQLENRTSGFRSTGSALYEQLIAPAEAEIAAASPTHLAIITPGKLRYIPFEALYDKDTNQYLLEKYPIHYYTRLSSPPSNAPTPPPIQPSSPSVIPLRKNSSISPAQKMKSKKSPASSPIASIISATTPPSTPSNCAPASPPASPCSTSPPTAASKKNLASSATKASNPTPSSSPIAASTLPPPPPSAYPTSTSSS